MSYVITPRVLDKRYKKDVDTGAMSKQTVPLPLKPMPTEKVYYDDKPKQYERLKYAQKNNRKNPRCKCKPKPKK